MKKNYRIAEKGDTRKIAEFLATNGELLLPMVELIESSRMASVELVDMLGRASIEAILPRQEGRKHRLVRHPDHVNPCSHPIPTEFGAVPNLGNSCLNWLYWEWGVQEPMTDWEDTKNRAVVVYCGIPQVLYGILLLKWGAYFGLIETPKNN